MAGRPGCPGDRPHGRKPAVTLRRRAGHRAAAPAAGPPPGPPTPPPLPAPPLPGSCRPFLKTGRTWPRVAPVPRLLHLDPRVGEGVCGGRAGGAGPSSAGPPGRGRRALLSPRHLGAVARAIFNLSVVSASVQENQPPDRSPRLPGEGCVSTPGGSSRAGRAAGAVTGTRQLTRREESGSSDTASCCPGWLPRCIPP